MLVQCPTCESRNTPGAPKCSTCGYRLVRRATPFVVPELPAHIRVDAYEDGPVSYRASAPARLRVVHRSELLPSAFLSAVVACMALVGGLFVAAQHASTSFAIVCGALLVVVLYAVAAKMTSSAVIELKAGRLRIAHGPLPWPGAVHLNASDIVQIYCDAMHARNGLPDHYRLHALLRNGERRMLLTGVGSGSDAQLLEDLLETRLGIADGPVED